jgi:pimeloyl-ACP methyl ester carboxylesterase
MPLRDYTGVGGTIAPIRAARGAGDDYGATAEPNWREVDWQAHLRQAQIGGRRVNYVDIGESAKGEPPVVFVHGLGGCWQNWIENIPRAAQERRVIAMDLPGFAGSEMPVDDITISGYAESVLELIDSVGIEGPVVPVGNSMGGFISAEIAIRHPARTERLVLVSAAGISSTNMRRRPVETAARATAAVTNFFLARRDRLVKRPTVRHLMLGYVLRHPTRIRSDLAYQIMHGTGSPGFLPALGALADYDFRDRLGEIEAATLLVWGRQDNLVPVQDADEYERLIPNARKVILEDTGHVPMIERPRTFNELLLDFLHEQPPAEAPEEVAAEGTAR